MSAFVLVCAAASCVAISASAAGQPIETVIVTAQKRPESALDVPMSITALSADALRRRHLSDISDLDRLVPGLSYTQTHFGTPIYTLRGIGFYDNSLAASPAVSITVDEVPLPLSAMARGALFDIERVEVLKGPQGTLYGQNSTGGAINFVRAKAGGELNAGAFASFGTDNDFEFEGFVTGPLRDRLRARAAVKARRTSDWQNNYERNDHLGGTNFSQARLSFEADPLAGIVLELSLSGWLDKSDTQAPQLIAIAPSVPASLPPAILAAPLSPDNARAANWNPGKSYRVDNSFSDLQLRAEWQLTPEIALLSLTSYQRFARDELHNADGMRLENSSFGEAGEISSFFQELRLRSDEKGPLHWLAGFNYEREAAEDRFFVQLSQASNARILGSSFKRVENFSSQKIATVAFFGSAEWRILDELSIEGGLRYTKAERDFSGCSKDSDGGLAAGFNFLQAMFAVPLQYRAQPGGCVTLDAALRAGVVTDSLDEDNISWRAGMKWRPLKDMMLYANASRGYKIGSFPTLSAASTAALAPVCQEELTAFEAGVKSAFWENMASVTFAGFHYDYTDKQWLGYIVDPIFGRLSALQNIPESSVNGAEMELRLVPNEAFSFRFAASYATTRIDRGSGINAFLNVIDFKGLSFPYTPRWQLTGNAQYRRPVSEDWTGVVDFGWSYRSSTMSGFSSNEPLLRIAPYWLVDLRLGVESADRRWSLFLWGKNLTDSFYWTNAIATVDTVIRYAGRPQSFGVSASYALQSP